MYHEIANPGGLGGSAAVQLVSEQEAVVQKHVCELHVRAELLASMRSAPVRQLEPAAYVYTFVNTPSTQTKKRHKRKTCFFGSQMTNNPTCSVCHSPFPSAEEKRKKKGLVVLRRQELSIQPWRLSATSSHMSRDWCAEPPLSGDSTRPTAKLGKRLLRAALRWTDRRAPLSACR